MVPAWLTIWASKALSTRQRSLLCGPGVPVVLTFRGMKDQLPSVLGGHAQPLPITRREYLARRQTPVALGGWRPAREVVRILSCTEQILQG